MKALFFLVFLFSFTSRSFAASKCMISIENISDFNSNFQYQIVEALSKRGYVVTTKEPAEDEKFVLTINYGSYYHNPIDKFVESTSTIETPKGRIYSSHDRSHGGSIFKSGVDERPAIIGSIKGLPKCGEVLAEMEKTKNIPLSDLTTQVSKSGASPKNKEDNAMVNSSSRGLMKENATPSTSKPESGSSAISR